MGAIIEALEKGMNGPSAPRGAPFRMVSGPFIISFAASGEPPHAVAEDPITVGHCGPSLRIEHSKDGPLSLISPALSRAQVSTDLVSRSS
jgi:hypothetical protein